MKVFTASLAFVAFVCLALTARADDKKEPATEQEFLMQALACNNAEIKFSELAAKQASNEEVKKFAQKMVEDHKKAREEMLACAKTLKVNVGAELEKEHQEKYDKLAALKGAEFDREYMRCAVESHEKALKMLETWSKKAQDKTLVECINKCIPAVKQHLQEAKQISEKLKS